MKNYKQNSKVLTIFFSIKKYSFMASKFPQFSPLGIRWWRKQLFLGHIYSKKNRNIAQFARDHDKPASVTGSEIVIWKYEGFIVSFLAV